MLLSGSLQKYRTRLQRVYPRSIRTWTAVSAGVALLISIPVLSVLTSVFTPAGDIWEHLANTVLWKYVSNSLLLICGVSILVLIMGVPTAWVVSKYQFTGKRWFNVALFLPFAFPAYIMGYVYTYYLDVSGPVQHWLRMTFNLSIGEYWFPEIRSTAGAIIILALVFYPYVFMLARVGFRNQSHSLMEAAQNMGYNSFQSFWRVALPIARPGIIAGLALVLMETLNDFGTVQYFGIQTFTTGIYRTWFGLGERVAAAQLAAFLMGFIILCIVLERWSRSRLAPSIHNKLKNRHIKTLSGWKNAAACILCFIPVFLGFLLPLMLLVILFIDHVEFVNARFLAYLANTITIAALASISCVMVAVLLAYSARLSNSAFVATLNRLGTLGYAIPGSVIAVGILIPFGWFDNTIDSWFRSVFGISTGLLLSGTVVALVFAYIVRFLAVAFGGIETSLQKVTTNMDEAARGMGYSFGNIARHIHLPMLKGSMLTAALLVFVDVMKELPATLIVRPFNFDTLAVQVYRLASDERLGESSGAALAIVLAGLIPVVLISRRMSDRR